MNTQDWEDNNNIEALIHSLAIYNSCPILGNGHCYCATGCFADI